MRIIRRVAQLVEHCFDVARVSGSNPLAPIINLVIVNNFVGL